MELARAHDSPWLAECPWVAVTASTCLWATGRSAALTSRLWSAAKIRPACVVTDGDRSKSTASASFGTPSSGPVAVGLGTGTRPARNIDPAFNRRTLSSCSGTAREVVVLSRGRQRRLETTAAALSLLEDHDVAVVREETSVAIEEYNRLAAEGRRVAALFHTTC